MLSERQERTYNGVRPQQPPGLQATEAGAFLSLDPGGVDSRTAMSVLLHARDTGTIRSRRDRVAQGNFLGVRSRSMAVARHGDAIANH